MSKASIEEILTLQTGSLATHLRLLDYRCGAQQLIVWAIGAVRHLTEFSTGGLR